MEEYMIIAVIVMIVVVMFFPRKRENMDTPVMDRVAKDKLEVNSISMYGGSTK